MEPLGEVSDAIVLYLENSGKELDKKIGSSRRSTKKLASTAKGTTERSACDQRCNTKRRSANVKECPRLHRHRSSRNNEIVISIVINLIGTKKQKENNTFKNISRNARRKKTDSHTERLRREDNTVSFEMEMQSLATFKSGTLESELHSAALGGVKNIIAASPPRSLAEAPPHTPQANQPFLPNRRHHARRKSDFQYSGHENF